ncbi:IS3 family transposase [Nonomuraea sp. NEAU-A123]|uniref:IS3 family transposase n=1 Tax=Nonomuraea sp. NEAU-A123 TaxID=2839649 RepID=UPI001BE414B8|nr:IS3 family transposase [Nonomuraea sp. NEAU-A123]
MAKGVPALRAVDPCLGAADLDDGRRQDGLTSAEKDEPAPQRRSPAARARRDAELTEQIRRHHQASDEIYGAPRIHADRRELDGVRVGRERVARLMRAAGVSRRKGCRQLDFDELPGPPSSTSSGRTGRRCMSSDGRVKGRSTALPPR